MDESFSGVKLPNMDETGDGGGYEVVITMIKDDVCKIILKIGHLLIRVS